MLRSWFAIWFATSLTLPTDFEGKADIPEPLVNVR